MWNEKKDIENTRIHSCLIDLSTAKHTTSKQWRLKGQCVLIQANLKKATDLIA